MEFNVRDHSLVPKHIKLEKEKQKTILDQYNITKAQLPRISKKDPAIKHLDTNPGDVIKITRESKTAGQSIFYRVVVNE